MRKPTQIEWVFYVKNFVPQTLKSSAFQCFRTMDSSKQNRRQRKELIL